MASRPRSPPARTALGENSSRSSANASKGWGGLLAGHANEARLDKMLVGGEGFDDAELAHDDEAGGIDERPVLVVVLFEQRPGGGIQRRVDVDKGQARHLLDS